MHRHRLVSLVVPLLCTAAIAGCTTDDPAAPSAPLVAPPTPGAVVPAVDPDGPPSQLDAWAEALSTQVGFSATALRAYGFAAGTAAVNHPECGITWTTLAGIGYIETKHGTYGGASLDAAGNALPSIRGAALDGSPGVADLPDTDGGELDGDAAHDRAVGPMQFIPETWRRWGVDADGDGVVDVDNITDAAATTARYLCASSSGMDSADGWTAALLVYNQSQAYGRDVLRVADQYATRSLA